MPNPEEHYDHVIIGSGLGGLLVAYLLAERGQSVCVLEKNVQFGGCLQIFARDKTIFDTGVHYVGELGEGEALHEIFDYFGLMPHLNAEQLDTNGFDLISFRGDPKVYPYAQGHTNFVEKLTQHFPGEEEALQQYVTQIKSVNDRFYAGDFSTLSLDAMMGPAMETSAETVIAGLTQNHKLRDVLAGNIPLYGGVSNRTPWHQHALIVNSYLTSAWRIGDGGAQIAKHLAAGIRGMGGELYRRREVVELLTEGKRVMAARTADGSLIHGHNFVTNIPPERVLALLDGAHPRKAYYKRLTQPEPTTSFFALYLKFKPHTFPYLKSNVYHYNKPGVWGAVHYDSAQWPESWLLYPAAARPESKYMETATVLAYMDFSEVAPWAETHNTTAHPGQRGDTYAAFKQGKAEALLHDMEQRFPGITAAVQSYYTSTPLTYRDYLGVTQGAAYGKVKDFRKPHQAFISPQSHIPNLYFTGQHVHLHGIKGVTTTALIAAGVILNDTGLYHRVKHGIRT